MKRRGWWVFLLAALCQGVHSRGDSVLAASSDAQIYRPALQPSAAPPPTGTYELMGPAGRACIKATLGAQFIVVEEKKSWFLNLEPSRVSTGGHCGSNEAVLVLKLPDDAASLQFTFRKENNLFYVTYLSALVSPLPVCNGCANKTYSGSVSLGKMFAASFGRSFTCASENVLPTSAQLKVKLVPLQLQAFGVPQGRYGPEVECSADFRRRAIPIILGAVALGVVLIAIMTSLFIRDRRTQGYDRI